MTDSVVSPNKCIIAVICPGQEDNISDLTYDSVICQTFHEIPLRHSEIIFGFHNSWFDT